MKKTNYIQNNDETPGTYILKSMVIKDNGVTFINPLNLERDKYLLEMFNENYKFKLKNLSEEYQCYL